MGLALTRVTFDDWLTGNLARVDRKPFRRRLERHVGRPLNFDDWVVDDDAHVRVGSYTAYGVFVRCLEFLVVGEPGDVLAPDQDVEKDALSEFRQRLLPASASIRYAEHFLEVGDTDTLFIPKLYPRPFEDNELYVASLPGALQVLERFSQELCFDLCSDYPDEMTPQGQWLPIQTASNVARTLHSFLRENRGTCVAYV